MNTKKRKNYNQNGGTVNEYADVMLNRIKTIVEDVIKRSIKLDSAIVESVNENGTVNIYFPPDADKVFTRISNQTPYNLVVGDNVEVLLKNGSYSNCWVVAKHNAGKIQDIPDNLSKDLTVTQIKIKELEGQITQLQETLLQVLKKLDEKANLESPEFVGIPKVPTATSGTSDETIANTKFVMDAINNNNSNI